MKSFQDTATLIGSRYQIIEMLGSGGMGSVFRANDRLTGDDIAIKRVNTDPALLEYSSSSLQSTSSPQMALANEFRILASLKHPNVISVLDYGFDQGNQPFFTMELIENPTTIKTVGTNATLYQKIGLIIQVFQALSYLHWRGVIHRDLKPSNILVVNEHAKVLDFGLSVTRDQASLESNGGTVAYMPPEVLSGGTSSERGDLYAVGIILYELIVGTSPFPLDNFATLLNAIVHQPVDLSHQALTPEISQILDRLIAKNPAERYQSADEVIKALNPLLPDSLPLETYALRESFLQSGQFVGRDSEINHLADLLKTAVNGKGSALLIGGESGIGKSRLLEELRIRALVNGAQVVNGQEVSDGRKPYQGWRNVFRWLSIAIDTLPLEQMVLKTVVSDLDTLLRVEIPTLPELDANSAQERFLATIETLIQRETQPLVIVIEDLHWAGSESLTIFSRLVKVVSELPILLLGSYRDDEVPDLPQKISGIEVMRLKRLDKANITQLSGALLGISEKNANITDFLEQETEGNVFFLIEAIRALADQAGQIRNIGEMTLPAHLMVGGIEKVIRHRLERIPEADFTLLQHAAIIGRQIDYRLLQHLYPSVNLEAWATLCVNAAILEAQGNILRFAHDKIREQLLANISPALRTTLHRQIGEAIENLYPDSTDQITVLAYHWEQANVPSKAVGYLEQAALQVTQSGNPAQGIQLINRAVALSTDKDPLHAAHQDYLLGLAYNVSGDLVESAKYLERTLVDLGMPLPKNNLHLGVSLLGQVFRQILHRAFPNRYLGKGGSPSPLLFGSTGLFLLLPRVYFINDELLRYLYVSFLGLNMAEKGKPSPDLVKSMATSYSLMNMVSAAIPLHSVATSYAEMSLKTSEESKDPLVQAIVYYLTSLYELHLGNWAIAEHNFIQAYTLCDEIGNMQLRDELQSWIGVLHAVHGDFETAWKKSTLALHSAQHRNDIQGQTIPLTIGCGVQLRLYPTDITDKLRLLNDNVASLMNSGQLNNKVFVAQHHNFLGIASLYQGNPQEAWKEVQIATETLKSSTPIVSNLEFYERTAETYLRLWEMHFSALTPEQQAALPKLSQKAVKSLKNFAKVIGIAQPRAYRWEGVYKYLSKNPEKAQAAWQHSLEIAQKLDMPYDQALAYYELGRHLPPSDPHRDEYLKKSVEMFKQLGAHFDLELAEKALTVSV